MARRRRFYLLPLAIIGLVHFYVATRLLPDLPFGAPAKLAGLSIILLSAIAIPLGLFGRSFERGQWADRIAAGGLFMMGLFSSLLVFTLLRDIVLLVAGLVLPAATASKLPGPSALLVLAYAVFSTLVGLFGARRLARIKKVDVPLANLPQALHGFTIAQITDIHVGPTIKGPYVTAIVDAVNKLNADLIAVTGDLVDGSVQELARHVAPLAKLKARHGAYFVTGNHEYYSGERAWTEQFKRLGMRVLMNEHVVLDHGDAKLLVAGVSDYSSHHFDPQQRSDPAAAMKDAPANVGARILLAHQPRTAPAASEAGFDLQISGHTHGGQFWPWNYFVRFQQPFTAGLHKLNALWVYISRGTGYWGPPNRFGSPSEITHLRLLRAP